MVLKFILRSDERVWTVFVRLRIGTCVGPL